jgi:hypothetical protein
MLNGQVNGLINQVNGHNKWEEHWIIKDNKMEYFGCHFHSILKNIKQQV